jgi:hypothetical protein
MVYLNRLFLCVYVLSDGAVGIYARGPWAHLVGGTMEQNAIYHVMAHAVAQGHCLPYTARNTDGSTPSSEAECSDARGVWALNPESVGFLPGEKDEPCDTDAGKVFDACGVCGGSAILDDNGKPVLNAESCDCAGHVLDSEGMCGGFGLDVCGVPGGSGIAPGKCDCAGNVQDCTGTVSSHPWPFPACMLSFAT